MHVVQWSSAHWELFDIGHAHPNNGSYLNLQLTICLSFSLHELSSNSPVCGQLQLAGNEEVLAIMEAIVSWVDITQPPHREQLKLLQQKVLPVLSSFILKCYCGRNHLYDVCCLVLRLRDLIVAPFVCCEPAFPPPCQSNSLSFFPKLPQVQAGKGDVPSWPP